MIGINTTHTQHFKLQCVCACCKRRLKQHRVEPKNTNNEVTQQHLVELLLYLPCPLSSHNSTALPALCHYYSHPKYFVNLAMMLGKEYHFLYILFYNSFLIINIASSSPTPCCASTSFLSCIKLRIISIIDFIDPP